MYVFLSNLATPAALVTKIQLNVTDKQQIKGLWILHSHYKIMINNVIILTQFILKHIVGTKEKEHVPWSQNNQWRTGSR